MFGHHGRKRSSKERMCIGKKREVVEKGRDVFGGARDRIKQPGMWGGEREEELIREVLVQKGCVSVQKGCVCSKAKGGRARKRRM